jgi:hypothetical protein
MPPAVKLTSRIQLLPPIVSRGWDPGNPGGRYLQ